ncbi:MAG: polysaccharide biosynthesis/export family protein [Candidatus Zhuqueibacterota bacterium]
MNKMSLQVILFVAVHGFVLMNCQPYYPAIPDTDSPGKVGPARASIKLPVAQKASPVKSATKNVQPEYQIEVGDVIEVKFFYQDDLNEIVTVRPDGRITLQRIGAIYALGMTPSRLQEIVTIKYAEIIKEPEVTVFIRKFSDLRVYVMGEVKNPGGLIWQPNQTIARAVAEAGGFSKDAKYSSILLLRLDRDHLQAIRINLKELLRGGNLSRDIRLKPNDVIFVPSRFITHVKEFVTNFYDVILPPLDMYYRATVLDRIY